MASPRRTESESVPIWLKLSEDDAAQMEQVLARPEFAGWTRAEWCLEIIQTALRYYARRPVAEPGRERGAPARPPAPEPSPPAPERESAPPKPRRAAAKPKRAAPKPARAASKPARADPEPTRAAPESAPADPEPVANAPGPATAPPEPAAADPDSTPQPECPHPADARDYQTRHLCRLRSHPLGLSKAGRQTQPRTTLTRPRPLVPWTPWDLCVSRSCRDW